MVYATGKQKVRAEQRTNIIKTSVAKILVAFLLSFSISLSFVTIIPYTIIQSSLILNKNDQLCSNVQKKNWISASKIVYLNKQFNYLKLNVFFFHIFTKKMFSQNVLTGFTSTIWHLSINQIIKLNSNETVILDCFFKLGRDEC